jgi:hypothetical protein
MACIQSCFDLRRRCAAVPCLACPTQKGNGKAKFFKFGPYGKAKTGPFDVGRFVAKHLRTPSHQRNWDTRAVRVRLQMRGLPPGPSTAPQAQLPPPETRLQVMSRTHNADFNITATLWSCRRCGKQGAPGAPSPHACVLSLCRRVEDAA